MGRPRQFDEARAVEAACQEFWEKGFEGTSTEGLCRATGLTRSSLYNAFHSKERLFGRALMHYVTTTTARQEEILGADGASGLDRVRRLLDVIVDDEVASRESGRVYGCFVVNTLTTMAANEPGIAQLLEADQRKRLASWRLAVLGGQLDGSIVADRDPGAIAWFLTSLVYGMRVAAQSGAEREALEGIAVNGLAALRP